MSWPPALRRLPRPCRVLADRQSEVQAVLRDTPDGTKLTLDRFSPEVAAALTDLKAELARSCEGR